MHKIQRNLPPDGLKEKSLEFNKRDNYTTEEIEKHWRLFTNSKLKKETVAQLEKMFDGCCAYCEGSYMETSYPHIDHFKPKSIYPALMFEYNNMNLSCEKCNKAKSNIDDIRLINPTIDTPEEHLYYESYLVKAKDEKGEYNINIFKLNDNKILKKRVTPFKAVYDRMVFIQNMLENIANNKSKMSMSFIEFIKNTIVSVETMSQNGFEYCSMYRDNFEEIIQMLKEFIKKEEK